MLYEPQYMSPIKANERPQPITEGLYVYLNVFALWSLL